MDRTASYSLYFSFPFNSMTSGLYSEDEELKKYAVDQTIQTIQLIIASHGFISMESVMKYLELRPTRHCPGIYFTEMEGWELSYDEMNQTDILTLCLSNEMRLRPVLRFRDNPVRQREDPIREIPDLTKAKEEKAWQEEQKETSESAENGKTSSDSSRKN